MVKNWLDNMCSKKIDRIICVGVPNYLPPITFSILGTLPIVKWKTWCQLLNILNLFTMNFPQPRKHTTNTNNPLTGVIHGRTIDSAGPTIFANRRTRTVNGVQEQYFSYSILGPTTDQNGKQMSTTFKLNHLTSGAYGKLELRDAEGNPFDINNLDQADRVPSVVNGQQIEGYFNLSNVTAVFTPAEGPKEFFIAKTDNAPLLTTVIASAPKATNDYVDELFAMVGDIITEATA